MSLTSQSKKFILLVYLDMKMTDFLSYFAKSYYILLKSEKNLLFLYKM